MADTPQTQYDIHPPEGVELDPGTAERWSELFQQANLSPEQARDVASWYWLLSDDDRARQIEREILRPQEVATLRQRQQTLMAKRHAEGLNPGELKELMTANERLRALQGRHGG